MHIRRLFLVLALVVSVGLLAASCGDDDDEDGGDDNGAVPSATQSADGDGDGDGETGTIRFGLIPWDEAIATTYLWEHILEEEGYSVEIVDLDVAPLFAALAAGDIDVFMDAWLPSTHGVYMDEFGEDINEIGTWYEPAGLYLTVPSYVEAESLADLADMADAFDSTITGIEAGAGMMGIARDSVMPAYGLEGWDLLESSTPAMLTELESAINNEEPIVVTLWSPGWWYGAYDLTNLEDPENAWGDPDHISAVSTTAFPDDFPTATQWLENFEIGDQPLADLENMIRDMGAGNEADAVDQWLEDPDNQALVDGWLG